ncbi:SGNH/GDSL hydrolase family protein [Reichenbachiella sp. MALMAid0571]|uniref:SGNH/GDSL hydrolase family protein n=1 Tax=Reichenbachiella sp. MALMAid0571 TaxID=3143939 RepID=UPI0032DE7BCF
MKNYLVVVAVLFGFSALSQSQQPEVKFEWSDIKDLGVRGQGWLEDELFYNRLPHYAKGKVTDAVWGLSAHTSGFYVEFKTNAPTISAKWTLTGGHVNKMPHFASTGVSGLDLYTKTANGQWHWVGVGKPNSYPDNEVVLIDNMPTDEHIFLLYLPLYNGVSSVQLGVPSGFNLQKVTAVDKKQIVFYGTSITQGGCASRPGMSATAILSRQLNCEVVNLGFSGSGKMELEMAELLGELNPEIYFLDCLPNMDAEMVASRVAPFVKTLRKLRPHTPIVMAENRMYENAFMDQKRYESDLNKTKELRKVYETLMQEGVLGLHYLIGKGQLGYDGESTVDGSHPTDLGFMRQADYYRPILERILEQPYVTKSN